MIGIIILIIAIAASIAWLWSGGINYMMKNHPDYKGEDFFNEEDKNEIL
jgi:hypothetical protein